MILDFTTLSDNQIKSFLKFIHPIIIEKGEIERYILSGKCVKIKISYYDIIIIEPEKIYYYAENNKPQEILSIEDIQNCVNIYNILISNN